MELPLERGMALVQGKNGQGKSNLLEAIYLLAIAKSARASTDREMVRWQPDEGEVYTRVAANVRRNGESLRIQIDLTRPPAQRTGSPSPEGGSGESAHPLADVGGPDGRFLQKHVRVNGVPRRASDLVGQINAVLFTANDLETVYGPPSVRRRYLDILISQLERPYLRALQRYQRIVYQRNHLLKMVRERRSNCDELDFWNDELVSEGKRIMAQRSQTIRMLSELARPIHQELTAGAEELALVYRPSVDIGSEDSEEAFAKRYHDDITARLDREILQGVTLAGPHRDDLQLLINGMSAGAYASRGQSRTTVLSMKLAEAMHMTTQRGQEPVLLLDDVLSELDAARRAQVLERVSGYQQSFITTADADSIEERFLSRMSRFVVRRGCLSKMSATADEDPT